MLVWHLLSNDFLISCYVVILSKKKKKKKKFTPVLVQSHDQLVIVQENKKVFTGLSSMPWPTSHCPILFWIVALLLQEGNRISKNTCP